MIRAAVVGVGYWGPNLLRNLAENPSIEVKWICDLNGEILSRLSRRYPAVQTTSRYQDLLNDASVELIVVATPVNTHLDLSLAALRAGKHVLVTKPMAASARDCEQMIAMAEQKKRILMVDHTFVYHPAVQTMKSMVGRKDLGELLYFQSTRMNLGLYQPDVSVIYDLMAHDLSILNELIAEDPIEVSVVSKCAAKLPQPDIAYVQLNYASGFLASLHASWLSPYKIRETILAGSKKMVVYDDVDVVQKIKIFDKGVDALKNEDREQSYTRFIQYRQGDVLSPAVPATEALKIEIAHLVECIEKGLRPRTDGYEGLRVVRVIEQADRVGRSHKSWTEIPSLTPPREPALRSAEA